MSEWTSTRAEAGAERLADEEEVALAARSFRLPPRAGLPRCAPLLSAAGPDARRRVSQGARPGRARSGQRAVPLRASAQVAEVRAEAAGRRWPGLVPASHGRPSGYAARATSLLPPPPETAPPSPRRTWRHRPRRTQPPSRPRSRPSGGQRRSGPSEAGEPRRDHQEFGGARSRGLTCRADLPSRTYADGSPPVLRDAGRQTASTGRGRPRPALPLYVGETDNLAGRWRERLLGRVPGGAARNGDLLPRRSRSGSGRCPTPEPSARRRSMPSSARSCSPASCPRATCATEPPSGSSA